MSNFDILLEKAKTFHGDACPGIVMGTRMTIAAMRELKMDPLVKHHNLIVYVEIDRCATDAIQAITGCSLGHRSLKHMNYGKFAATFVNQETGEAVRVSGLPKKDSQSGMDMKQVATMLCTIPEEEIFTVKKVKVEIPKEDIPGMPTFKATCSRCGEQVMDHKEVERDGIVLCKNCANGSYYTEV